MALGAVLALLNLPGAIPAGGTSAPARPRPMLDPVPAWAVPIQITNAQSAATGTYQQMVVVNSSRYSAYLNANDSNVGWAYPNGTAIYAWMESNATNTSARTTWWLKLYNIPADSNQTVYLDIYGETSYLLSLYGPSGEAPQLSATYGGLDDGARVFTDYWNFSSATNAVSFSSYAACSDPVSQTATFSDGLIFGAHASCQWYASSVGIQTPAIVDSTGWCYVVSLAGACYGVMLSNLQTTWSGILYLRQVVGTPTWSCSGVSCPAAPVAVTGANYTLTVSMSPSGADANISVNYTSTVTQSVAISTTYWVGVNADNNTASHFYWLRVRAYPPNGIMPTAAFASPPPPTGFVVTSSTASTLTLGWSNSGNAANDTLYWGPNCSALRPFDTSLYPDGSLGARSNLTLLDLPGGTAYCFALSSWNLAGPSAWAYTQGRTALVSASLGAGSPPIAGGTLLLVVLIVTVALTVAFVALPALFGDRRKSKSKPTRVPAGRSR